MGKSKVKRIGVPIPELVAAERREGERSEPTAAIADGAAVQVRDAEEPRPVHPDPEVTAKAKRRFFTAEYKQRILREVDLCKNGGAIGALLRREGSGWEELWRRVANAAALPPRLEKMG
jgi:transposase